MAFRQTRMIEVIRGIVRHAKLFHHAARSLVYRDGERDDLVQTQYLKAVLQRYASAFGSQAPSPIRGRQSPPDFDAGRKVCVETRHIQANEADEGPLDLEFCGEKTESPLAEMLLDAIDGLIAFHA
jgi:hypothetical protein